MLEIYILGIYEVSSFVTLATEMKFEANTDLIAARDNLRQDQSHYWLQHLNLQLIFKHGEFLTCYMTFSLH